MKKSKSKLALLIFFLGFQNFAVGSCIIEEVAMRRILSRTLYQKKIMKSHSCFTSQNGRESECEKLSSTNIFQYYFYGLRKFDLQEKTLPEIWTKRSQHNLELEYQTHLERTLKRNNVIAFGEKTAEVTHGFIVGNLVMPPSVYSAGMTCLIDEFHLRNIQEMQSTGQRLLKTLNDEAKRRDTTQLLVLNDSIYKNELHMLLSSHELSISSLWFGGTVIKSKQIFDYTVERIQKEDVESIVKLSEIKRRAYEKAQPLFWKMAKNANEEQYNYLLDQITWLNVLPYCIKKDGKIRGFVIGELISTKPFYQNAQFCRIDDFIVSDPAEWNSIGCALLSHVNEQSIAYGSNYLWVVSGAHDTLKLDLMKKSGLKKASEWWTGRVF